MHPIQNKPIKPIKPNKKEIILLEQGTYGCIFKPEISCKKANPKKSIHSIHQKYVSKIQLEKDANRELEIGKIIQKIPSYRYYFAPILDTCPVNVSTIDQTQIEKCNLITRESKLSKQPPKFISSKIQYLGKTTIGDYLFQLAKNPRQYIEKILDTHLYLLDALSRLDESKITHLDIKGNNIMYNETNDLPIIIDFGMAIKDVEGLDKSEYKSKFPTVFEEYFPWCIDIIIMSYIAKNRATHHKNSNSNNNNNNNNNKTIITIIITRITTTTITIIITTITTIIVAIVLVVDCHPLLSILSLLPLLLLVLL